MKKLLSRTLVLGITLAALSVAQVASAIDTNIFTDVQPPTWRGQPNTTSQGWLFNTPDLTVQPEPTLPTGGLQWLPSTVITIQPLGPWIQSDPVSGRTGIWPLSGTMNVTVDNYPIANPVKWMSVQIVWQDIVDLPATGPILSGFNPAAGTPVTAVGPIDLGAGWFETTYKWNIYPNPPDESFVIGGNINVDQVIIDTACVPEPSGLLLGILGGGLVLVLRWRGHRSLSA